MKFYRFIVTCCILLSALFLSCATTGKAQTATVEPVYITNTKKFFLLPADYLETSFETRQLLTGSFGASKFSLQTFLQVNEDGIFLSLFNDFGTGMGTLSYNGIKAEFDSPVFPKAMKAEYIAADLQFAYYNTQKIQNALDEIGMNFEFEKNDKAEVRRIINRGLLSNEIIEEITKTDNTITIKNLLRGYEYTLLGAE